MVCLCTQLPSALIFTLQSRNQCLPWCLINPQLKLNPFTLKSYLNTQQTPWLIVLLHIQTFVNNCIAKMEGWCLKHPGASTIGSQLLDEDCSHGWQILATQPWSPTQEEGGKGGGRRTSWAMSCPTLKREGTPPVRTPRYAMLQSTSRWNSETCAYVLQGNASALCC